jgi:hypothetical protein
LVLRRSAARGIGLAEPVVPSDGRKGIRGVYLSIIALFPWWLRSALTVDTWISLGFRQSPDLPDAGNEK